MNNPEDDIIQIQYEKPKQHFFVYNNMKYPIDFDLFKYTSKYFLERSQELCKYSDIDLNVYDPDNNISKLPSNDVITFIKYVQRQRVQITNENICTLHLLSHKYEINQLINSTENYIHKNQNEIYLNLCLFNERFGVVNDPNHEKMIAQNLSLYLNNEDIFKLKFSTFKQIFEQYQSNKDSLNRLEKKDENNFMMKALSKYGREASVLFKYADISTFDNESLTKMLNEYSNIMDFQFIGKSTLKAYLDLKKRLDVDDKSLKTEIKVINTKEENHHNYYSIPNNMMIPKNNQNKIAEFDEFIKNSNQIILFWKNLDSIELKESVFICTDMTENIYKNGKLNSNEFKNQLEQFKNVYFCIKYPSENFENIYNDILNLKRSFQSKLYICIFYHGLESTDMMFHGNCEIGMVQFGSTFSIINGNENKGSFEKCSSLMYIQIPSSVLLIKNRAFRECTSLTSIVIPKSVNSIGNNAFEECISLMDIKIPSTVISIGNYAFKGCTSLAKIDIPFSVYNIGNNAFEECSSLINIDLPKALTCINDYTFSKCSSLQIVDIPSCVTSIGSGAFFGCSSLTCVIINAFFVKIGDSAFCECRSLQTINIKASLDKINDGVFYNCLSLNFIKISSFVKSIGNYAFSGCKSLTNIEIPSSTSSIGNYSFRGCTGLTRIKIPYSVIIIGESAFEECSSLKNVEISTSVQTIKSNSFKKCSSLTNVKIPYSVTKIGKNAFSQCSSLISIQAPNSLNIKNIGISSKVQVDYFTKFT